MRGPRSTGGDSRSPPLDPKRKPGDSPVRGSPSGGVGGAGPSSPPLAPAGGRRGFLADLIFLLLASAALIVPSWLSAPSARRPILSGTLEAPRRIDLNRSAWYEWTLLPGIGEARARRIVSFRAERGGFRSLEDLEAVPGMPRGFAERVRPFVVPGDPPGGGAPVLR